MGLNQFPGNRQLLTEAAQIEQDHGDLKKAQAYWSSVRALDDPNAEPGSIAGVRTTARTAAPVNQLAAMLMSSPNALRPQSTNRVEADQADSERNDELFSNTAPSVVDEPVRDHVESAPAITGHGPSDELDTLVVSPISSHVKRRTPSANEMSAQMQSESQGRGAHLQLASTGQIDTAPEQLTSDQLTSDAPAAQRDVLDSSDSAESSSSSAMADPSDATHSALLSSYASSNVRPVVLGAAGIQSKDDGLASLQAQMSPWFGAHSPPAHSLTGNYLPCVLQEGVAGTKLRVSGKITLRPQRALFPVSSCFPHGSTTALRRIPMRQWRQS